MKLGESFSFGAKLASVQRQFKAGLVIVLFCDFITDPKPKWLLVVSASGDHPLFFIINTDPTNYAKHIPRLKKQQLAILRKSDPFLDHDSWVDCSTVYNNFELGEIEEALANDMDRIKGVICKETALAVLDLIMDSDTLERRHINQISAELSELM